MEKLHKKHGIILILISAFVFATSGLFVKSIEAASWDIIFWRAIFSIIFSGLFSAIRGKLKTEFMNMGRIGVIVAIVGALGTSAFVPAFKFTTVANVSLIYALSPLIAGVLAWVFVNEPMNWRQIIAVLVSILGAVIIVSGSLNSIHIKGDLFALLMTLMMSTVIVLYRAFPLTPAAGPAVLSSIFLLGPAAVLGNPVAISSKDMFLLIAFGLVFAIASITLMEGAKRLSAAKTALLSSIETPLAPILALVILSEIPTIMSIVGGIIIFCAVIFAQKA